MIDVTEGRNNRRVYVGIDRIRQKTRFGIEKGFFFFARDIRETANKNILKKPRGGRVYIVRDSSGRRRRHRASKPFESHANLSGRLRRSIGWKIRGARGMEFGYGVDKDTVNYAPFVEFGTSRMAERPSLKIAIEETGRNAEKYFEREFSKEFER